MCHCIQCNFTPTRTHTRIACARNMHVHIIFGTLNFLSFNSLTCVCFAFVLRPAGNHGASPANTQNLVRRIINLSSFERARETQSACAFSVRPTELHKKYHKLHIKRSNGDTTPPPTPCVMHDGNGDYTHTRLNINANIYIIEKPASNARAQYILLQTHTYTHKHICACARGHIYINMFDSKIRSALRRSAHVPSQQRKMDLYFAHIKK